MPIVYEPSVPGELRQGEILGSVWEHRALHPAMEMSEAAEVEIEGIFHPFVVVMTSDCDLAQDYAARKGDQPPKPSRMIDQILFCELFSKEDLASQLPMTPGKEGWRRFAKHQDERYHCFPEAPIGSPPIGDLPELYLDFKRHFAAPAGTFYEGIEGGHIWRLDLVPLGHVHRLMHRFFGYLSRVGVEE